ncbi:hypothetical protein OESDEN_13076 [Oesophagostomum dentatum]|uniref:E2 domain-containing protein n=1 Tax=Oesophagostomum dentatum TaxID=61180 RepID=A0A0B1SQG1_OESDE|nr:hypothetical protein OESDEN_13076 [Oesophagostomum dentatum]
MKEWGELEARYQQMKKKDAKGAESFKVSMTNRFQKDSIKELRVDIEPIIEEKPAYYRQEKLVQNQKSSYSENGILSSSQAVFMVGAVAIASLTMLVAAIVRRRRAHHGFIEVDVYTPEERHVAGMQVNGYENPTYSFFDSKA